VGTALSGWSGAPPDGHYACVSLCLHHKVQKFSSGTGSPGLSRKKGRKTAVVWCSNPGEYLASGVPLVSVLQEKRVDLSEILLHLLCFRN